MELGNLIFGNSRGEYELPREEWQERFVEFLERIGCDYHGYADPNRKKDGGWINYRGGLSSRKFDIYPYYWGEDDKEAAKPNFIYHPTGLEIQWYKYPLRGSYSNQKITYEELCEILKDCEQSLKERLVEIIVTLE
jgi:hypothetical protein